MLHISLQLYTCCLITRLDCWMAFIQTNNIWQGNTCFETGSHITGICAAYLTLWLSSTVGWGIVTTATTATATTTTTTTTTITMVTSSFTLHRLEQNVAAEWLALLLVFWRSLVQTSAHRRATLTEVFVVSLGSFRPVPGRNIKLGHNHISSFHYW